MTEIVRLASGIVVVAFGLFLVGLGVVVAVAPPLAERFLRSFASSARAHFTEQGLRLLVGAAVVVFASSMWHPGLFRILGWLIVVTAVGLLLIPWRSHQRFAWLVMPQVYRRMRLFAAGALFLGAFILYSVFRA